MTSDMKGQESYFTLDVLIAKLLIKQENLIDLLMQISNNIIFNHIL